MWNSAGVGLPILVAVVTIPHLIEGLGAARFGILSLAWMVVGYFSLFDFGLGRAMTQLISEKLGKGDVGHIPSLAWSAMTLMSVLGAVGGIVVGLAAPWLVGGALKIPPEVREETLGAFYALAVSIPVVVATTGLRGILEAHQRFDLVNVVRIPLGVITYVGPLAVLPFSIALSDIVMVLVAARFVSFIAYLTICLGAYPEFRRPMGLHRPLVKRLLTFGGWMTVSNITAPLLLYLGRVLIAVLISAEAVAYFSTPYDVVINLLVIPGILVTVLYPTFAQGFFRDGDTVRRLYNRSMAYIFVVMLPMCGAVVVFAEPGLAWWINEEFSVNGYRVAQCLAVGIFINSFGHLSQALVQAYGRPDLTAKLHVLELVAYIPYLWWLVRRYGIEGAAVGWTIRVLASSLVLAVIANRCMAGKISRVP